jgi:hypothetical protein
VSATGPLRGSIHFATGRHAGRIILPGKVSRKDLARCRRNKKESVAARDRRILEFPLSISPNAVAKALIGEGWYSKGTTVFYIEYRVRRLRAKAERERATQDGNVAASQR